MSRPRSLYLNFAVYLAVRLGGCLLLSMPVASSVWVVRCLALVLYRLDRRHRDVSIENLRQAFPGHYHEHQLQELTLDVYRHFTLLVLELLLLPRRSRSPRWREQLIKNSPPEVRQALNSGRPILIATAHYGNWELSAFMLQVFGTQAHLVARPMDNPYLDQMMRRYRESMGHKVLSKHGDLKRMREVLASGGTLCTLADQDAGSRGIFVDFFGRPASTHRAIAHLAQRTGALIIVAGAQNQGELLKYCIRVTDIIDPEEYAHHPDATYAITQRVTTGVELLVRYDPRQYFWLHRRWKHRPPQTHAAAA